MCSVNDVDFDGAEQCMENKTTIPLIGATCKKCNERKAEVVLRTRDAYCRECFLSAATHKFRASLGKSKIVRPKDHILIAFSGNQSSVALLHLVNAGLNEASHKRLLFTCSVVYIDEGAVLNTSQEERKEICISIVQQVEKFNLPCYVTSLERSLDESDVSFHSCNDSTDNIDTQKEEQLEKLISSIHSLTAKEDLVQKLKNRLLLRIAKQLKCSKFFSAETASHLSVKLLSNISLGRGAQLPLDIGFSDTRNPDVMLLRPMRDFMKKEVAFYNIFNNLTSIVIPSLTTKAHSHASIQKLTEKFVTDLQEEFPATVSTIFRTGDKLSLSNNVTDRDECCALCQAPLDTNTPESSALQATEFSRMVSALGPSGFDNKSIGTLNNMVPNKISPAQKISLCQDNKPVSSNDGTKCCSTSTATSSSKKNICGEKEDCQCSRNNTDVTLSEVESCLCYSCRLIAREMDALEALPVEVMHNVKRRLRFQKMRKEIEDFLL